MAYFILELVEELDLGEIEEAIQSKDPRGTRPYSPAMMVGLVLYAYSVGVYSSRKIERATYEDVAFRVLAGGSHPFFTTIHEFRKTHEAALSGLFVQVLALCRKAGLVKLGHVAIDGTKVQAAASKHKAMSYGRMVEEQERLEAQVSALLERAEAVDQEEDARFGEGQREEDLPEQLRRHEGRAERIRKLKAELEAEARASRAATVREQAERARQRAAEEPRDKQRKADETRARRLDREAQALEGSAGPKEFRTEQGLPMHRVPARPDGTPHPRAQRNFVDPDSRIMERGGSFLQGYNCQLAVDEDHQVIVAQAVTNQCPDNGNLLPLLDQVHKNCEASPHSSTADAGYWSPAVEAEGERRGIALYVAPDRQRRASDCDPPETSPTDELSAKDRMRETLRSPEGRAMYARRKAVVEPVFGQIKDARGFRRFLVRGLEGVSHQWALLCTAHNLLKLYRATGLPA